MVLIYPEAGRFPGNRIMKYFFLLVYLNPVLSRILPAAFLFIMVSVYYEKTNHCCTCTQSVDNN